MQNGIDPFPLESPEPSELRRTRFLRNALDVIETVVFALLIFAVINTLTARIRVDGMSMEPTLETGEFVIINKLAYRLGTPKIGDVIVFHYPRNPEQEYIKRVIGLVGDQVVVGDRQVKVNGQVLDEPYIAAPPRYELSLVVPENSLFVLGDNRNNSSDSHDWGPVPMANVVGKAVFIYWPVNQWGAIQHVDPLRSDP